MSDLAALDAVAQAQLVRSGDVTPQELLDEAICRIDQTNPQVNAIVTTMYDEARAQIEAGLPAGPFTGVPFLLKDGGAAGYAGTRQTSASRYLLDNVSAADGQLTRRYKAAGLVCCGKTNLPEFGLLPTTEPELFGPTRNPWDPALTAGGSSGGAAAAVAARMVPMANASDSGGSIRIPASCCGVFGMKPTRLRIASGRRHLGVSMRMAFLSENSITLSVRDSAALLDASQGPIPGDPFVAPRPERPYLDEMTRDPGRLRIVVSRRSPLGTPLDPDTLAAVDDAARLCESLGHSVEEGVPDLDLGGLSGPFAAVTAGGLAWDVARLERTTGKPATAELFEPATWELIERGRSSGTSLSDLMDALAELQTLCDELAAFQAPYDVWLTPTTGSAPPPLGTFRSTTDDPTRGMRAAAGFVAFTSLINVSGQPAMSVPLYWTDAGVPIGAHFVGPYGDEGMLFRLAAQLEQARPWADRVPPPYSPPPTSQERS